MALKARVTTLEGLDEGVAALYRKADDGSYVLDVDPVDGWNLENVTGLKSTTEDWKAKYKRLKDQFGDLDPTEAREALKTLKELEAEMDGKGDDPGESGKPAAGKPDPVVAQLQQKLKQFEDMLGQEKKAREDERARFKLQRKMAMATEALSAHTEDVRTLKPHLLERMIEEEGQNGEVVYLIRGDDGEPVRVSKSGSTDPQTILNEYVGTKMRGEFPRNFPGTKAAGGGMVGTDVRSVGGVKTIKADDQEAITRNLEKIGKGEVVVDD